VGTQRLLPGSADGLVQTLTESSHIGLLIVLALLFLVFSLATPNFLTPRNMVILAGSIAMIGIVAGAMTLVIIGGNLDLSVAGNIAMTSVVVAKFLVDFHAGEGVSILAGVLTGLLIGMANGVLIARLASTPLSLRWQPTISRAGALTLLPEPGRFTANPSPSRSPSREPSSTSSDRERSPESRPRLS
jgi:predicted ABC-type sugar transport system permease subunit